MDFYQGPPTPTTVDVEALSSFLDGPASFDFSGSLISSYNGVSMHNNTPPIFPSPLHTFSLSPPSFPPISSNLSSSPSVLSRSPMQTQMSYALVPLAPSSLSPLRTLSPPQQIDMPHPDQLAPQPQNSSTTPTSSSSNALAKRKRRRKDESALPDEVLKGFDWTYYQSPSPTFMVFDNNMRSITEQFDLSVFKCGTNTHYSPADQVWICYRQNQFKVFCLLKSPQPPSRMFVRDGANIIEIAQFYVKLYAIKSPTLISQQGDEVQVGLVHVGKSRVKKEKTEITPIPFMDDRAEFTNLQFERSNVAKGQPEYFHLVVGLFAKTASAYYLILSKISPKILVRSQHPGFYGQRKGDETASPEGNRTPTDTNSESSQRGASATTSEDGASPKPVDMEGSAWQANGDALYHVGKVGINTSEPTEALTVHGNALITGNLYKPSDRRIKSDITPVDSSTQLDHIKNLKIYDYKVKDRNERGVLAQELQEVLPNAVQEMGDVTINDQTIPNLLVVNERVLLYENIGATQQLDKQLEKEKSNIIQIDNRMQSFAESTNQSHDEMKGQIQSISDLLFAEEISKGEMGMAGMREEQIAFGLNLFRMGPARSILVLGYFYPWLWAFGAIFMLSSMPFRRVLGRANLVKFIIFCVIYYLFLPENPLLVRFVYFWMGFSLLMGNYRRNCKRIEEEKKKFGAYPPDPPQEKLSRRIRRLMREMVVYCGGALCGVAILCRKTDGEDEKRPLKASAA